MSACAPTRALVLTLTLAALLSGCAGGPARHEEARIPPELLLEARRAIEIGSPASLRQAVQRLTLPERVSGEAEQTLGLAGELFRLLYPELDRQGYLPATPPYSGPYGQTLERAARGEPPALAAPPAAGAEAAESPFLQLLLPCLFIARLPEGGALPDPKALLSRLEEAAARNPRSVLPPYLLGRVYERTGDEERAIALYRRSAERDRSFYPGPLRLAGLYLRDGRSAEAIALLAELHALLPGEEAPRTALIQAYLQVGEPERAEGLVAEGLLQDPGSAQYLRLRVDVLLAQGNWSQSLRPLELLLQQHPDYREAYLLKAEILHQRQGHGDEALQLLRQGEERFPDAPDLPELAGRILMELGRMPEALGELQKALDREPGRVSTLRLLLADAVAMERWAQAELYLSQVPQEQRTREDLLQAYQIYVGQQDPAQALIYAESLYRASPNGEDLVRYARCLQEAGRRAEAAELVEKGLDTEKDPSLLATLYYLKALQVEPNSQEEALAYLRQALMQNPDELGAIMKLADLYLARGQPRRAALYLKRALELDPGNAGLRIQLEQAQASEQGP
jgi:tetratricopeptide (TPR) repeat protein